MSIFAVEKLDVVKDGNALSFYKVFINGECQFDQFCDEIAKSEQDQKKLNKIYAYMNYMAESNKVLPSYKFNSIVTKQKVFGHEFKDKDIRVYVLKIDPNVFVVLGGYKKNQNADTDTLLDIIDTKGLREFVEKDKSLI